MAWLPALVIEKHLGELLKLKIKKAREPAFRVSSLPYCPIYNLYEQHHSTQEYPYSMGFYTNLGTAVHSLMQEFIPHLSNIKVFGNWQCRLCKKPLNHKFHTDAKKEYKTSCTVASNKDCWPHVEYVELELSWRGLSGHTDMLLLIDGKWYLVDFKTISSALWRTPAVVMKSRKLPSDKYYEQIESYAALLYMLYKIKIDFYVIMYVGRDSLDVNRKPTFKGFMKPFNKSVFKKRKIRLEHFVQQHELAMDFRKKPGRKIREKLIKARPCHDAKSYQEKMGARFEYTPCELWSNYTCRTDSGVNQFLKDIALLETSGEKRKK